jgi:D-glycero-alpha-D-manno-heptose-7-phosphate kinase
MIISKTPFRVSLFGGGTDYPAHFKEHGGAVLGFAIDKYCWITVRRLPPFFEHRSRVAYTKIELVKDNHDIVHPSVKAVLQTLDARQGLEIHHDADIPAKSGMGSSSAFTVGLINAMTALNGSMITKRVLADNAIHVEQEVIKENVGCQDQIWAAYGGLNKIEFYPDRAYSVQPVILKEERRKEFEASLALYFTGFSRIASEVAGAQIARAKVNAGRLLVMQKMVDDGLGLLASDAPLSYLGEMLHHSWMFKRELAPNISDAKIDEIYQTGLAAGAWGGKLLGAGAGGFMLFMVGPGERAKLREAMRGLIEVGVRINDDGSKIVLYQPNGL